MSWTLSSRGATLVVLFALAVLAVGTAGAVSISDDASFNESQVGEEVSTVIVIEDPFQGQPDSWTLRLETELRNVSWVVSVFDQGTRMNQTTDAGQEFSQELSVDNGGDEVRVDLSGETPPVDEYSYQPRETYTLWEVQSVTGGNANTLDSAEVHHHSSESHSARRAIDRAAAAIEESGGNADARDTLNNSISSYNNGNFGNAEDLANDARDQAQQAEQSQQQTQLFLYGVVAVVLILLVGGGIYYWQSQQDDYGKLQ